MWSCIKDEPQNMECDILSAWVEGEDVAQHFFKPSDMTISHVAANTHELTFTVRSLADLPDLALLFTLTPSATITPENGSKQNFREGPVVYTVASEDQQWHKTYTVNFRDVPRPKSSFDFEHFDTHEKKGYYRWFELQADGTRSDIWATGNEGFYIAKPNAAPSDYPTTMDPEGYDGHCVKLVTHDTGTWGKRFGKPIAAGNLFLGQFNSKYALTNTLLTTEMGITMDREPVSVAGYYKYRPGTIFTDKNGKEVADRTDEPSIYAVFYTNTDADGTPVMLHGDDVLTSSHIVSKAQVASLPPTDVWTRFEMTFASATPVDLQRLKEQGYNLALVFSSSKTGDTFEGAVGSTLYIDKVEIVFKAEESDAQQ